MKSAHWADEEIVRLTANCERLTQERNAAIETAGQLTMDVLQTRTEIAAIYDMLTDEPACWAEGISRLRMLRSVSDKAR